MNQLTARAAAVREAGRQVAVGHVMDAEDLDAYLRRIGYEGERAPTLGVLRARAARRGGPA